MNRYKVTFLPHQRSVAVAGDVRLLRAALDCGVHINASCGGEGVCGKCRVIVEQGTVAGGINERLSDEDLDNHFRLACCARIQEAVTIRIPTESAIDCSVITGQVTPRRTASVQPVDFERFKEHGRFTPPVEKIYLELLPPDAQNHLPDVTRLVEHLKRVNNEHQLALALPVIRALPGIMRAHDFKLTVTLLRSVRADGQRHITNVQPGDTTGQHCAIALDIGTTTIYAQLIDLTSGVCRGEAGSFNGQISYGEDVISRIIYAEKPAGLEKMQEIVVATINEVIAEIIERCAVAKEDISVITMAGNTTMTQLLLALDPSHLRRAPYVPAATFYPPFRANTIGLNLAEHTTGLLYPAISSYVGGDIVAGVVATGMHREDALTLFLDIGTNAEIVIGNKDWLACTACSAGPAFEGGGITFGMRAAQGAIEDFSIDPVTYEPMLLTIGDVRPQGICGSGLITMTAVLFEMGIINNRGVFDRELKSDRIREQNGVWEYVLAWQDDTQIGRDIVLTEIDIDNLIRAKGAVYSGCMTLLKEVGLSMELIERIILAGGFGSYIDLERAMTIGLLPEIAAEKVVFIGNASLMGARLSSLTNRIRQEVVEVTQKMTNFELSETPSYMDHYVAAMFIPHTEIDKFPAVKKKVARWQSLAKRKKVDE